MRSNRIFSILIMLINQKFLFSPNLTLIGGLGKSLPLILVLILILIAAPTRPRLIYNLARTCCAREKEKKTKTAAISIAHFSPMGGGALILLHP